MLRQALNLKAMMNAGITINRNEMNAVELVALLIIEEETARYKREKSREQN